jgi:hypothetical protein
MVHPLEQIRVMVIGLGGVVGEMIEAAVEAEQRLALVRCEAGADPAGAISEARPHVVVVEASDYGIPPSWLRVLARCPGLRVLAVDPERGTGVQYEMRPHAVPLGDVSPADIVALIQSMPEQPWEPPRD